MEAAGDGNYRVCVCDTTGGRGCVYLCVCVCACVTRPAVVHTQLMYTNHMASSHVYVCASTHVCVHEAHAQPSHVIVPVCAFLHACLHVTRQAVVFVLPKSHDQQSLWV